MNIFNKYPENSVTDTDLQNIYSGEKILATDMVGRMYAGRCAAVRVVCFPLWFSIWQKIFILSLSLIRRAHRYIDKE
jgi:hypothetical protein